MAPAKPRFGGGRIMENNATRDVFLPMDLERETRNTSSMEASLHTRSCEPKALEKDEEKAGRNKSEAEALPDPKENDTVAPDGQYESQSKSEKEPVSSTSKGESAIDENESEESQSENFNDESVANSFRSSKLLAQNDSEPLNRNFEDGKFVPEESSAHSNNADVKQLMSVLQSLGIHVEIKPYVRSASISTTEMDSSAAKDGLAQEKTSRHIRPIDLSATSLVKEMTYKNSSKCDKKHDVKNNFLYCKNLFLKDRQDHYYLIIAEESASVDFKVLKKQLSATRNLSFADVTATERILGEKSGGINPFVAMRESARGVRFVLHQSLLEAKTSSTLLAFHPLDGSLQVEINVAELTSFLKHFDKQLEILSADLSSSGPCECSSSKSDQVKTLTGASKECKQKKVKEKDVGTDAGDTQALKLKQDNNLLNPIVNGKPLWKVHMRKGKLKSFLKATNNNINDMADSTTSKLDTAVEEFKEKEPEIAGGASCPNTSITNHQTEKGKFANAESKHDEFSKETRFDTDNIEQANCKLDSQETTNSLTLPEITQFYNNLSDLCVEFQDLDIRVSTTRDIGPSVGCKCFFLKDRRENYYLIISHEYYDLDHGRLKKALKPKKKLDPAEPADILENLGVQPSRITPFSCTTDRAMANNVAVFITDKILPPEVILCIQHPYAEGRRLIMKSGELQRYLSTFLSSIGKVEEKAWPERYARIFTRFTEQSFKLSLDSQDVQAISEKQQNNIPIIDAPELALESELQTDFLDEKGRSINSSKIEQYHTSIVRNLIPALRKGCEILGNAFLLHVGIDNSLTISSLVENENDSTKGQTSHGSSVDPPAKGTGNESHGVLSFEESLTARGKDEKVNWAKESTTTGEEDSCTNENVKCGDLDWAMIDRDFNTHRHKPNQDGHSDMDNKTSLTVEDILQHLRDIAVDFTYTDSGDKSYVGDETDQRLRYRERKGLLVSQENPPLALDSDAEDRPSEMPRGEDENKADDHDDNNVEICTTAYLCGVDNSHYIVVGGESDYLTKRRLRRLFHIPGPLRIDDAVTPGLATTPFSLALALKERNDHDNRPPKIYVILFTSLYLDPETKCVFHLDRRGSTLKLTSSNLENFVTRSGMECWYVP